MKILLDVATIKVFVKENEYFLKNNYVNIAQSDIENFKLCITYDDRSGLSVLIFGHDEVIETWDSVEEDEIFEVIEDALDILKSYERDESKFIQQSDVEMYLYIALENLGIDEGFWDDIVNDFCATLELYDYRVD